jgi:integrase/recombinase XerD
MIIEDIKIKLDNFCDWLIARQGLGEVTISGYLRILKKFLRECETDKPTHKQIDQYIVGLRKNNYSYSHIVNSSLAIEWYMRFIKNPIKLGRPRKPRPIIQNTLNEAEIVRIILATKNIREKAIITLLAYSGIRNKELCNLKVKDFDLVNDQIRVLGGKFNKDRIAYINGDCVKIITEYLKEYPRVDSEFLFTALVSKKKYNGMALRKLCIKLARLAKIEKRVFPHLFRHSLATNLLNRGAQLVTVQNVLGHSFIESTMVYAKSFPQRTKTEYNNYCPCYI